MAGRAKENFPGGSLKYLFVFFYKSVYLNVVTVYIYICDIGHVVEIKVEP